MQACVGKRWIDYVYSLRLVTVLRKATGHLCIKNTGTALWAATEGVGSSGVPSTPLQAPRGGIHGPRKAALSGADGLIAVLVMRPA